MSKESISRDRWRQSGQSKYGEMCPGCGYHAHVNGGRHRADCTAPPPEDTDQEASA